MTVLDKIDQLIQESEKEREAAQPDYVTPDAAKDITDAGADVAEQSDSGMAAGILNKIGQAAEENL